MKLTQKQKAKAFAALRRFMKGPHWETLNEIRASLIDQAKESAHLDALQSLASLRRMTLAPYRSVTVPKHLTKI